MSFKDSLRKAVFCSMLAFASMTGAAMDPQRIEELLSLMNATRVEVTITDEKDEPE